jgi:hypothetical protein
MEFNKIYTTFYTPLMEILSKTEGDIIEVGIGVFSTPLLHWYGKQNNRTITSYETDPYWIEMLKEYQDDTHEIIYQDRYTPIEKQASVVFIDSFPWQERNIIAMQFKDSDYVIVHDVDMFLGGEFDGMFTYRKDYPEFKTSVFSNKVEL